MGLLGLRLWLSPLCDGKTGPKPRFKELVQHFSHLTLHWMRNKVSLSLAVIFGIEIFPLSKGSGVRRGRARLGIQEKENSQGTIGLRTSPSLWSEKSEVFGPGDHSKVGPCPQPQGQAIVPSTAVQ